MVNKALFMTIFTMMISFNSLATLFHVIALEQLIEESSHAAEVELKYKKTYKNDLGMIMTDFTFKVMEGFNLNKNDTLTITMAGGTLDGITSFIDSAPEFFVGEKSFILLKEVQLKFYLSNFTMGKYKIEEVGGQIYYISTVFPNDPDIGRVKKERMLDLIKSKFKMTPSTEVVSIGQKEQLLQKSIPILMTRFEERKPAQIEDDMRQDLYLAMWGFFALLAASGLMIWWKLKKE